MKSKLLFPLAVILVTLNFSCSKSPDLAQLSANFIVATNIDKEATFTSYKTYYVSDTIALIKGSATDTIWNDAKSKQLVDAVKKNMAALGYTFVNKGAKPDIGINMLAVKVINVGVVYPGWGWGYAGWWDPWYWGWYYPYYYPWSVYYTVTTGSVSIDMVDLKSATPKQQLRVVWSALLGGALGYSGDDIQNAVGVIDQAYLQSPGLKTN